MPPAKLQQVDRVRLDDLIRLLQQYGQLGAELTALATARIQAVARRDPAQQAGRTLVTQRNAHTAEAAHQDAEFAKLDKRCVALQAEIDACELAIKRLRPAVRKLTEEVGALHGQLAELEHNLPRMQRSLQKLAARGGQLAESKQELLRWRDKSERTVGNARREAAAFGAVLASIDEQLRRLRADVAKLTDDQDLDVKKRRGILDKKIADLEDQRATIVQRDQRHAAQAARTIQEEVARIAEIDDQIGQLDAMRAKLVREHTALDTQINDAQTQVAALRKQLRSVEASLTRDTADLDDAVTRGRAREQDLRHAVAQRDAAAQARDLANTDAKALLPRVKQAKTAYDDAVQNLATVDANITTKTTARTVVEAQAVTALTDAAGVAATGIAAIQTGIANFGATLPIVPAVTQAALGQLDARRQQLSAVHTGIAPLDIASAPAHAQTFGQLLPNINTLIVDFNAAVDAVVQALNMAFAAASATITAAARARCASAGEWANAVWVDNNLAQRQSLASRVSDHIGANHDACLTNPAQVQAAVEADADELLRRWRIFGLRPRYSQCCFAPRVPGVLRTCLANGTSLLNTQAQIDGLRLNPDLPELRRALGVPTGGGWTMWGPTSVYDGVQIHVTISADSIRLPGAVINTFPDGTALADALFILTPSVLEIHATLTIAVAGPGRHPAVFFGGNTKYWNEYQQHRIGQGEAPAAATQQQVAARAAVAALLNQYKVAMRARCQAAIDHVAAGRDIAGNMPQ